MSNQVCRQCGYENDSTRVFCHNCGTRLADAGTPAGPPPAVAAAGAPNVGKLYIPPQQTEPKISPNTKPPVKPPIRSRSADEPEKRPSFVRAVISTAILGAALAAIIQMFRPIDGMPPAVSPNEVKATELGQSMETSSHSPYPRVMPITIEQANNFLAVRIVSAAAADEPVYRPKFVRAFVVPGNGDYRFFIEEKLGELPIYLYLIQEPILNGTSVSINNKGGGIGRLPIHPSLLPLIQRLVDPVLASVNESTAGLHNVSAVTVTPTGASLSWQGKPATP